MSQLIIPAMGSNSQAEVIEVLIAQGDSLEVEQSTLVLESEKATIEVPANVAGVVTKLLVKVGDKFKGGEVYAEIEQPLGGLTEPTAKPLPEPSGKSAVIEPPAPVSTTPTQVKQQDAAPVPAANPALAAAAEEVYAGPAVRRMARELGVDLAQLTGSGLKNRIQKEDVQQFVKQRLQNMEQVAGIPRVATIDFSQYGPIKEQPLNNIKRATAKAMTLAHLNVPQVTQFDEADITELEAFRVQQNTLAAKQNIKYSIVPFVLKVLARCLRDYPNFNASLNAQADALIIKDYVHLGVAVDTPKGLLVPVLRDVDKLSVGQIQQQLQDKAERARAGQLTLEEMQGANMSLSSLGGIGGTAFTPIVNPPEVAILGLSKATIKPVWQEDQFVPRLMLPLSLSYDHRVIDGAEAARFSQALVKYLQDLRHLLM